MVAEALSNPGFVQREVALKKKGSASFLGRIRMRAVKGAYGEETILEGTLEDITMSRVADEALREAERNYRNIVESALHGIVRVTPEGMILSCNPAALNALGFKDFRSLKRNVNDFWAWVFAEACFYDDFMRQIFRDGEVPGVEAELMRKGGETFWAHVKARYASDGREDLDFIYMFFADTTHNKVARNELKKSEETANALINAPADIIFLMDSHGKVLKSNKKAEEEFGLSAGRPYGERFSELWKKICPIPECGDEGVAASVADTVSGVTENLGRHYFYQIIPVSISGDLAGNIAVYVHDITEVKRAEMKLVASEARYRRLFEDSVLGIFKADPYGQIETVNPAYARMFGYDSPEELIVDIGKNLGNEASVQVDRGRLLFSGSEKPESDSIVVQKEFLRKDRTTFVGNLHIWPVKDQEGRVEYFEGFVEDVTELKNAENHAKSQGRAVDSGGQDDLPGHTNSRSGP